jgi:hypothetical protein
MIALSNDAQVPHIKATSAKPLYRILGFLVIVEDRNS